MSQYQSIQVQNSYSKILRLALPIGISILIPQISILTNTYFLGNYFPSSNIFTQQDLLAASGIAGIYYLTIVMVGYGLVAGILMLMSRKAGENDLKALGKLMSNGIVLCLIFSVLMMCISFWIAPIMFNKFIHAVNIKASSISFIKLRVWGLPFMLLTQLGNTFFLSTSNSKKIIIGSTVQSALNILFDYLLISGKNGFPEMGLNGSAIASIIAEIGSMIVLFFIIYFGKSFKDYSIRYFKEIDWGLCKQIFIKSSPLMLQFFLSLGAWEVFFIFIEHLGKEESAISQILRTVFGIVGVATWALGSTCNSMVSNLIGQGQLKEVIPMIEKVVKVSFSFAIILSIPILIFPELFLSLLVHDMALIKLGVPSLRIVIIAIWMLSVSTIYFNGILGTGNTRINMFFELTAIVFYLFYITIVVNLLRKPLHYAWASEFIYWFVLFLLSTIYLYSGRWKKSIEEAQIN